MSLSLSAEETDTLDHAARISGQSRAEFIAASACRAAEQAVLAGTCILLAPPAFAQFVDVLAAPPAPEPALAGWLAAAGPIAEAPVPLAPHHATAHFSCGAPLLEDWLQNAAMRQELLSLSRCYVLPGDQPENVAGYYSLSMATLASRASAARVPCLLLDKLAVDQRWQGRGVGQTLLRDAVRRSVHAASVLHLQALVVLALTAEAERFYLRHGFFMLDAQERALYLPLATAAGALGEAL